MARPAKPMFAPADEVRGGALSYADGAAFLGISVSLLELLVKRGELETLYIGRKPVLLRSQLEAMLAAKLEESRRARTT